MAKPKKTAEWKRRSAAAKKGAETKRENKRLEELAFKRRSRAAKKGAATKKRNAKIKAIPKLEKLIDQGLSIVGKVPTKKVRTRKPLTNDALEKKYEKLKKQKEVVERQVAKLLKAASKKPRRKSRSKDKLGKVEYIPWVSGADPNRMKEYDESEEWTDLPLYKIRRDGTIAANENSLRHLAEAQYWIDRLDIAGNGNPESVAFQKMALRIAREEQISIRELYTLWWSP